MGAFDELLNEAEETEKKTLQSAGVEEQYNLWRESMPDERVPNDATLDTFMHLTGLESAAQAGTLSVTTGGAEQTPDADIPTPGPDDDGGSPDAPGDISKGGDGGSDDLNIIPGMWVPPKEAEADNYIEPTTKEMVATNDWVSAAETFYEFKGSPDLDGESVGDWAAGKVGMFTWNLLSTLEEGKAIMTSDDPKASLAFLNLLNMYEHSDGGAYEFTRAVIGVLTDPSTYLGLGVGGVIAKGAAIATAKTGLKKAISMAIVAGSAGLTEGALLAGGFDLTKQNIEQEAGAREDINYGQAGMAAAAGGTLGILLGAGGGHLAGRYMDKFAAAAEKELTRQLGGLTAAETRSVGDMTEEQLITSLQAMQRASERTGTRDEAAEMALKILEGGDAPRLKDGSLDIKSVIEKIAPDVDKISDLEKAGFKVSQGEEKTDLVFNLDDMPDATLERIQRLAKKHGIAVDDILAKNPDGDQVPDEALLALFSDDAAKTDAFMDDLLKEVKPTSIGLSESEKLAQRIIEMDELERGDVVIKTASRPGSSITDKTANNLYELVGRTKNGWYKAINRRTGEEKNFRRAQFDVLEKAPAPTSAGPMSLDPFSKTAAKIISMTEEVSSNKLKEVNVTHNEQRAIVKDLRDLGVDITEKNLATHWTPAEMLFLRDTYNSQGLGIADMARKLDAALKRGDRVIDEDLARFNQAHTQFVATRDLFYGVSGNAARQLNILKSRPTTEVYQFSQSVLDSINMQGGRVGTERAIGIMADFARKGNGEGGFNTVRDVSKLSDQIWGSKVASAMLNVRYNMMLSSWRTHFFNFLGNSASGIYHHLMVTPVGGVINNTHHASRIALSKIPGVPDSIRLDPAERFTIKTWGAELSAHKQAAMESLRLAKEIAMGRDIGEGKIWNELGLRYDVINVPNSAFGKMGTTFVRLLEASDAFFKNQYYMSKIHSSAARKARFEEIHGGLDYDTRYQWWIDNAETDQTMIREAKKFAAKMTYTNDPNVYGGVFAALAKGMQTMQTKHPFFNMLVPFVRTPANLISYSMEMTGLNVIASPSATAKAILSGGPLERQEALSRLTVAAGLWYTVHELHKEGLITGAGPENWEEVEAWKAAGWQPNSGKFGDVYVDMSRAAPAGRALTLMATILDYGMLNPVEDAEGYASWLYAGVLYTADDIIDESYLSTAADFISAVQAKQEGRIRSTSASTINSVLIPNLLRDLRRPSDEVMRSSSSSNLLDQVVKQMKNAIPGLSDNIAPQRDWKGDVKEYYGNVYTQALVPFTMRDSTDSDPASMAIAYARIAPSKPNKKIAMEGGKGNFINLFAMDRGDGFVYDKFVEFVGKSRHEAVNLVMRDSRWGKLVETDNIGPGSDGDEVLREAINAGSKLGRARMIEWLIEHHGDNNTFKRQNGDTVMIHHEHSVQKYVETLINVRKNNIPVPEDLPQYEIRERKSGPEFFKP